MRWVLTKSETPGAGTFRGGIHLHAVHRYKELSSSVNSVTQEGDTPLAGHRNPLVQHGQGGPRAPPKVNHVPDARVGPKDKGERVRLVFASR